jgi:hypothetical protein
MKHRENLEDIYFQLAPENRACLTACAQLCRIAENAVKKNLAGGEARSIEASAGVPGKQSPGFDQKADP